MVPTGAEKAQLHLRDLTAQADRVLAAVEGRHLVPCWSADGKHIAYTDSEGLWVIDVGDPEPVLLAAALPYTGGTTGKLFSGPVWSPDNSYIVCKAVFYEA